MKDVEFVFDQVGRKQSFVVSVRLPDGTQTVVGTVRKFFVRHLGMHGWEATAADGHRAVHERREQAAHALVADLFKYPFPVIRSAVAPA